MYQKCLAQCFSPPRSIRLKWQNAVRVVDWVRDSLKGTVVISA